MPLSLNVTIDRNICNLWLLPVVLFVSTGEKGFFIRASFYLLSLPSPFAAAFGG
jgi:hypothetical protein